MFEILEPFFNILTADDKYSLHNSDNLQRPIQIQLPKGKKPFLNVWFHFWNISSNSNTPKFGHFGKKGDPNSFCIFETMDPERRA